MVFGEPVSNLQCKSADMLTWLSSFLSVSKETLLATSNTPEAPCGWEREQTVLCPSCRRDMGAPQLQQSNVA